MPATDVCGNYAEVLRASTMSQMKVAAPLLKVYALCGGSDMAVRVPTCTAMISPSEHQEAKSLERDEHPTNLDLDTIQAVV